MQRKIFTIICIALFFVLPACSPQNAQADLEATMTAQTGMEVLISEGVASTLTAMPSPTSVPIEEMSEEDLAIAVEASTTEAVAAADEAALYAESVSSDGELTQEELDELYYLYYWSIEELEQALYLMDMYYDLYDELINEAIVVLESLDAELQELVAYAEEMIAYLDSFSEILAQGGQILQENLAEFEERLLDIPNKLAGISEQVPAWMSTRRSELDALAGGALAVIPDKVARTRREAIDQVKEYVAGLSTAIADGAFSLVELQNLSQLGANASASIGNFGHDFAGVSDLINGLTGSFARGQLPQINAGIGSLQNAIPSIR